MSVSHSSQVPALAGGLIDMQRILNPTDTVLRRTKIICTIGPACWEIPQLETLLHAGMNTARLNFSHGDHATHARTLERIRTAATNVNKQIAILLDTKGPEIRTGLLANDATKISLTKGSVLILTSDYHYKGDATKLACSYSSLATSVTPGQTILIADGSLVLTVLSIDETVQEVTCRVENNASIGEKKNMNLPGVVVDLPTFTKKDVDDIVNFGIKHKVDFIAASFVRKASDISNLRSLLAENGGQEIKIIAKIENQEGLENYDAILAATDGIMVARGDLGMEIPPAKVFLAQKYMIRNANVAGKFVITATQMLESMISSPRPTRAECSDVANAVLDGTDCVMLSGETANGPYFEQAVRVMAKTCCEAEGCKNFNALFQAVRNSVLLQYKTLPPAESLASSAVKTAIDVNASIIVVFSETGTTARLISKYRPGRAIVMLTNSGTAARQANGVCAAVHAYKVSALDDHSEELLSEVGYEAVQAGIATLGDLMVVVHGTIHGPGMNNQVRVSKITSPNKVETASGTTISRFQSFVAAQSLDEMDKVA